MLLPVFSKLKSALAQTVQQEFLHAADSNCVIGQTVTTHGVFFFCANDDGVKCSHGCELRPGLNPFTTHQEIFLWLQLCISQFYVKKWLLPLCCMRPSSFTAQKQFSSVWSNWKMTPCIKLFEVPLINWFCTQEYSAAWELKLDLKAISVFWSRGVLLLLSLSTSAWLWLYSIQPSPHVIMHWSI